MTEVVAHRPKTYAYLTDDGSDNKKAKGTKKCVIKQKLIFENYEDCLFNNKTCYSSFFQILQKSILTNLKILGAIFCSLLFQIFKKYTYKSQSTPCYSNNNNNFKGNNLHKNNYTNR